MKSLRKGKMSMKKVTRVREINSSRLVMDSNKLEVLIMEWKC